mgnify:CR=1 FL=1
MTIHDSIIAAVIRHLNGKVDVSFKSGELRKLTGIPEGSFSPVFKGMRVDPGTAPSLPERVRGLFVQVERGVYLLSEKGKGLEWHLLTLFWVPMDSDMIPRQRAWLRQ